MGLWKGGGGRKSTLMKVLECACFGVWESERREGSGLMELLEGYVRFCVRGRGGGGEGRKSAHLELLEVCFCILFKF